MSLPLLTFYALAAVIVGSAILVVTRRNAISSAVFLALTLVAVGGLYVVQRAEFLFAVQVLVYTGGVMVLFLFVIMLVNVDDLARVQPAIRRWWWPVAALGFSFAVLIQYARRGAVSQAEPGSVADLGSNVVAIAATLFTDYLLMFEVVSVLLLVAMIGAIVLSKKEI